MANKQEPKKTEIKLTSEQERILREQIFDAEHPGPLLHDFQLVLDYVGLKGVKSGGKYNMLPIQAIPELDPKLKRSMDLKLKRPQLKSHPYLQGLHILLRSSCLAWVEGAGERARLVLDPEVLSQWEKLNPTERYFTLLEAWVHYGSPEMVGERGHGLGASPLRSWAFSWKIMQDLGRTREEGGRWLRLLTDFDPYYQTALLDLFGFVRVKRFPKLEDPHDPNWVRATPFGGAMMALLGETLVMLGQDDMVAADEEAEEEDFGPPFAAWQPYFQPYFPEWRQTILLAPVEPREGVFVFRVSLGDIWREIAIPSTCTLEDLATVILNSVRFDFDHLYDFRYRDELGRTVRAGRTSIDGDPATEEVEIGQLPLQPGQAMPFLYDYGDSWVFDVKLLRIDPPNHRQTGPKVVAKEGKAPKQYPDAGW